jgi:uncharacterized protein YjiS (DUF1127 family)
MRVNGGRIMARIAWNELEAANGIGASPLLRHLWPARRRSAPERAFALLRNAIGIVRLWQERLRQRRALAQLSPYLLRDLGITQYDAEVECSKPFWR